MGQTWWMRLRGLVALVRFRLAMRTYRWLQPHYRWSRRWHARYVREPARIPLRYHLLALRGHLRYQAAMAIWRVWRPLLLHDNRIWWAMALTEPVEANGRMWPPAGAFITRDDRVIVSHRRDRMARIARDLGWRLVRLSSLPRRYVLWEDWASPLMR